MDSKKSIFGDYIVPKKLLRHYLASEQPNTKTACSTKYGAISQKELLIVEKRRAQIQKCFDKFFNKNMPPKNAPKIAICSSGGGYRAMIATICFLENLNEILDITLYCSSLSGSAWGISAWMSSNQNISKFKNNLKANLTQHGSCISNVNKSGSNNPDTINLFWLPFAPFDRAQGERVKTGRGESLGMTRDKPPVILSEVERRIHTTAFWREKNTPDAYLTEQLFRKHGSTRTFFKSLITKYAFDQDISSTDICGALIMHDILRHVTNKQKLRLSDQIKTIKDGLYPIPLYAAISPQNTGFLSSEYDWFEFSPIDVRNLSTNAYVPTWGFAREYIFGQPLMKESKNGKLFPPELRISSYLGIFGSAFTINIKEAINLTTNKTMTKSNILWYNMYNLIYNLIDFDVKDLDITDKRFLPAVLYNHEYNPNIDTSNKKIHLIDAGLDFNLAVPPLLNREIDIIIIFDASSNYADNAPELIKAKNYANKKNLNFPNINNVNISSNKISIFKQTNCPTIIYVPFDNCCLNDFCGTFDFNYDTEKFNYLSDKAKACALQVKNYLRKIL